MDAWTYNERSHVCDYIVQFDLPSVIRSSKDVTKRLSVKFVA